MAQSARTKRRIVGMAAKRLGEAGLDEVLDPRDERGRRWSLPALLAGALVGLMAGCRSLKTDAQWLLLVRRHWGVETSHQILDVAFEEDDHPWIEQNPRATVVVMILRRIAYTLLALWQLAVIKATAGELAGLRRHRLAPAPA